MAISADKVDKCIGTIERFRAVLNRIYKTEKFEKNELDQMKNDLKDIKSILELKDSGENFFETLLKSDFESNKIFPDSILSLVKHGLPSNFIAFADKAINTLYIDYNFSHREPFKTEKIRETAARFTMGLLGVAFGVYFGGLATTLGSLLLVSGLCVCLSAVTNDKEKHSEMLKKIDNNLIKIEILLNKDLAPKPLTWSKDLNAKVKNQNLVGHGSDALKGIFEEKIDPNDNDKKIERAGKIANLFENLKSKNDDEIKKTDDKKSAADIEPELELELDPVENNESKTSLKLG